MALEFEKLAPEIERMAQSAYQRAQQHSALLDAAEAQLKKYATDWETVESAMAMAVAEADMKFLRAARPVDHIDPLDAQLDAPLPPDAATLMATDGSQILPDRHAAYLYSLINIGVITYYHGQQRVPLALTYPELDYPNGGPAANMAAEAMLDQESFAESGAVVNIRRDLREIQMLAATAMQNQDEPSPHLAVLDQRLLYWPTGGTANEEGKRVIEGWQKAMADMRELGCLLAGYITRPGKRSVLTMLAALDILEPGFQIEDLYTSYSDPGPTDADLFRRFLEPGQRSKVFADVSEHNQRFADQDQANEVCFFYLNPGRSGRQLARVDIPIWVAQDAQAVATVHSLIYDQCRIMGDYPYILTRADEVAVVSFNDHENLNLMIAQAMQNVDLQSQVTAKQSGKTIARAGRTRHQIP